jgi:hypothetical protein
MLDDVTDDNCVGEKSNVSNIDDLKKMFKKIDDRNRIIQRSLNENGERLQNRLDIKNKIIKDIDHLDYIENLKDYSKGEEIDSAHVDYLKGNIQYENNVTVKISIAYKTLLDFHKSIEIKYGYNDPMQKNIITLISEFNKTILGDTQDELLSYLKYKGREPRLDVLHKLKKIVEELYDINYEGLVRLNVIKQVIHNVLDGDTRVEKNYYNTIINFIKKTNSDVNYYKEVNLMSLSKVIERKLDSNTRKK